MYRRSRFLAFLLVPGRRLIADGWRGPDAGRAWLAHDMRAPARTTPVGRCPWHPTASCGALIQMKLNHRVTEGTETKGLAAAWLFLSVLCALVVQFHLPIVDCAKPYFTMPRGTAGRSLGAKLEIFGKNSPNSSACRTTP